VIATSVELAVAAAAAAGVGFLLAILAGTLWERSSDPRVRHSDAAYARSGIPSSDFDQITRARALSLLTRWRALSSSPNARVALIATSSKLESIAEQAAEWLSAVHRNAPKHVDVAAADPSRPPPPRPLPSPSSAQAPRAGAAMPFEAPPVPPHDDLVIVAASSSDAKAAPVAEAGRSNLVVLVVRSGLRSKELMESIWMLEQFGHRPEWILLVDSVRKTRRAVKRAGTG
jgi:hypothetical protein